jgi:hypothetical protein
MKIILSLDYELFFGHKTGAVKNCLIHPMDDLLKILDKYQIKTTLFVDAGYLIKLREHVGQFPTLKNEYELVIGHLKKLCTQGHDIQLHIHPHWEGSFFDETRWVMVTNKYKLPDFTSEEIKDIVGRYKSVLEDISGSNILAFRAGGWSMQPFSKIQNAFKQHDIKIDSTVFKNGFYASKNQFFDFRQAPNKTKWKFDDDPCIETNQGYFTEFPIASFKLSPLFFWKMAFTKLGKNEIHKPYGNGYAIPSSKKELIKLLSWPSNSVASIDGYKASFLNLCFKYYVQQFSDEDYFTIIGHPKAFTEYSLKKLEEFVDVNVGDHEFTFIGREGV